jgi:hypothetical protein
MNLMDREAPNWLTGLVLVVFIFAIGLWLGIYGGIV